MKKAFLLLTVSTVIVLLTASPIKAASASLSLTPASSQVQLNQSFSVTIKVNTGGENVNTVTANLTYPANLLTAQSVDTSASFATIWFENTIDSTNGEIRLTGSLPTPGTSGSDLTFAVINFSAAAAGTASVNFKASSAVYRDSDNTDILDTKTGGVYTIGSATPTPTSTPTPIPTRPINTSPSPSPRLPDGGVNGPTLVLFVLALIILTTGALLLRW